MFNVETTPTSTIIHVADDLDLSTRSTLRKMIAQAELSPLRVIVSLLSCTYVDASCLGALITSRVRIGPRFFVVMNIDTVLGKISNSAWWDETPASLSRQSLQQSITYSWLPDRNCESTRSYYAPAATTARRSTTVAGVPSALATTRAKASSNFDSTRLGKKFGTDGL